MITQTKVIVVIALLLLALGIKVQYDSYVQLKINYKEQTEEISNLKYNIVLVHNSVDAMQAILEINQRQLDETLEGYENVIANEVLSAECSKLTNGRMQYINNFLNTYSKSSSTFGIETVLPTP